MCCDSSFWLKQLLCGVALFSRALSTCHGFGPRCRSGFGAGAPSDCGGELHSMGGGYHLHGARQWWAG